MTVYGRILVVKALALSKVTHLIQVIPNPNPAMILKLQRIINNFIWKSSHQKKVVVKKDTAELPTNKGGLAVPNLKHFWDSLKLAWLSRLFQTNEGSTWKRLAMSRLAFALKIPKLTPTRLLSEGPSSISKASAAISNPFWQSLWKLLPKLEKTFYSKNRNVIGERTVWDNDDLLNEGLPFNRRSNSRSLTLNFNFIRDFVSTTTKVLMSEEEAKTLLGERLLPIWNRLVESITIYLTSNNLTWYSIDNAETGPIHWGWSRLVSDCHKAKKLRGLGTPNSVFNRRQRGRKAPGAG